MKKNRASAIIPYDNGLILIKRIKGNKEEYYTIPGGGQEEGESIEEATLREVREELGIEVELTDKFYELESQGRKQYFFVANYESGEIGSGNGEEMTNINYEKYGAYIPEIIPVEEIKNIKLLPQEIKEIIIADFYRIFNNKNLK
ncbi:MAG: NUDIX domain-containing protein [Clostridiales bacterium]|nr:NUDIX domain-containing protein [Clostridiales bacterium]